MSRCPLARRERGAQGLKPGLVVGFAWARVVWLPSPKGEGWLFVGFACADQEDERTLACHFRTKHWVRHLSSLVHLTSP